MSDKYVIIFLGSVLNPHSTDIIAFTVIIVYYAVPAIRIARIFLLTWHTSTCRYLGDVAHVTQPVRIHWTFGYCFEY